MCGVAGKIYFDRDRKVSERELRDMARTLVHRGPDGEGVWAAGNVGLAHRRLSIIDLRAVAGQPMSNEDGSIWITFNGEIYNFQDLRKYLVQRGHIFQTHSDTEVIVHAYEEYGRDCLQHLRGMFAFAIWDTRTHTLLLACDRVGKKPIFYFHEKDRFLFASEIKALFADTTVPVEPDSVAIDHYLALGYVPAPLSAFRGVQKLPPAHWLEIKDGQLTTGRYWKLRYSPKRNVSFPDAVAELRWQLSEAVRLRLLSDVPLGAFLSGGIDSSAVVAYMAQALNHPVRTFTVGFEDVASDERPFARMVADRYGTDHTELVVKADVAAILPRLVWHYDEPFGDPSAVPSYAIAELTRQYVTVALNGDGGDESFAGYTRYVANHRAQRGEIIPLPLRRTVAALIDLLPKHWRQQQPLRKISTVAEAMAQTRERRYSRWFGQFSVAQRQDLYTTDFKAAVGHCDPEALFVNAFGASDATDWVDSTLDVDIGLYLPGDLLVKMDRASMAHSLEARSPFLDHVLMEFAASLPPEWKLAGTEQKHILKAALRGVVPDAVLDKPKQGFEPPLANWFREDLREMAHDLLLSPRALQRGYFTREGISSVFREHYSGQEDRSLHLWELLMFELWNRTFIDGEGFSSLSLGAEPLNPIARV
ncbi:MAG: asparagine synthase (glutamine-hydrolyzing) [Deltaproteobacteria bacterium]|nr:asparagine synthase (glutamine-hydrolyzing) [Deltaproteobacteria bacterium]